MAADDRNIARNIRQRQKYVFPSHICYNELTIAVERTVQAILPLDGYAAMASGHRQLGSLGILTGESNGFISWPGCSFSAVYRVRPTTALHHLAESACLRGRAEVCM